jgi:hypothetical protein
MYIAKKSGKTDKGNEYTILQISPTSFAISVQSDNDVICDTLDSPPNLEFIEANILSLETELLATLVQNETS